MRRKHSIFTLLAALSLTPLAAQADGYGANLPDVDAQILQGWVQKDGTLVSALHLDLPQGWKTYWRTPGEGGIPPQMDWTGSRNLSALDAQWPTPEVFVDSGMTSYGYADDLILPLIVTPKRAGKDVVLKGDLDIGVCKDICVPVSVSVKGRVSAENTKVVPKIAAALAERPFTKAEARVASTSCKIRPSDDGVKLIAQIKMPSSGGRERAVVETQNPDLWAMDAGLSRSGQMLSITSEIMHAEGKPFFLDRTGVTITVLGANYAVEIKGCSSG